MSARLERLREMRAWIDAEIEHELSHHISRDLIREAADLYGVAPVDIVGGKRTHAVSKARHAAAWLLRRTGMSYPEIGRSIGCDHTSALYACRKIDASPAVRALLVGLEAA